MLNHTEIETLPDTLDKNFQEVLEMRINFFPKGIQLTTKKYSFSINIVYTVKLMT